MYFAPGTAYHIENHADSPLTGTFTPVAEWLRRSGVRHAVSTRR
jgi:hypothetical protein